MKIKKKKKLKKKKIINFFFICATTMGNRHCSNAALKLRRKNNEIDKILVKEGTISNLKILLLGSGTSGKTSLLKQFHLHSNPESNDILPLDLFPDIFKRVLLSFCSSYTIEIVTILKRLSSSTDNLVYIGIADKCKSILSEFQKIDFDNIDETNTEEWLFAIHNSWEILKDFVSPNESLYYYMNKFDEIMTDGYNLTIDDIMRLRIRTTGIIERTFSLDLFNTPSNCIFNDKNSKNIVVIETGGPRNERKKWIHCFTDVSGVFFLFNLSIFKLCWEDMDVDYIEEQILTAAEVIASKFLGNDYYIIFSHLDVFLEELEVCKETLLNIQKFQENNESSPVFPNTNRLLLGLFYLIFKNNNSYVNLFDIILKPNVAFLILDTLSNEIIKKAISIDSKWDSKELQRRVSFYAVNILDYDECDKILTSILRDQIFRYLHGNEHVLTENLNYNNDNFIHILPVESTTICKLSYSKLFPLNILKYWEPEIHYLLPKNFKDCIFTLLVIARSNIINGDTIEPKYTQCDLYKLPNEILYKIFSFML